MIGICFKQLKTLIFVLSILIFSSNIAFSQLFGPQRQITGGDILNPNGIYSNDLNADFKPDIVVSSFENEIVWYRNLGGDHFDFQETILDAVSYPINTSADIDGDGDIDIIAVPKNSVAIAWYENDGSSSFISQHIIDSNFYQPYSLCVTDIDNDNDVDILVVSRYTEQVLMFLNDGIGNFSSSQVLLTTENYELTIWVVDLNSDGNIDILVTKENNDNNEKLVFWIENIGSANFGTHHYIADNYISQLFSGDIDGDNDIDLIGGYLIPGMGFCWYENNGSGVFEIVHAIDSLLIYGYSVSVFDIDNDDDIDLLVNNDSLVWYENDGYGNFNTAKFAGGYPGGFITPNDLNDDGLIDFVAMAYNDGKYIYWCKNLGDGTFGNQLLLTSKTREALDVTVGDIDGDGDDDIISASGIDRRTAWYENVGYQEFGDQHIINEEYGWNMSGMTIVLADMDSDEDVDVLGSYWLSDPSIVSYVNDGEGHFDSSNVILGSSEVDDIYAADFDGDENIDILSISYFYLEWHENLGNGAFQSHILDYINGYNNSVFAADIDNDIDVDIIYEVDDNYLALLKNDGLGNFSDPLYIGVAKEFYLIDLDDNGYLDIVGSLSSGVVYYSNLGGGIFADGQIISESVTSVSSFFCADFDNDGDNDILCGTSDSVIWLENSGDVAFEEPQLISDETDWVKSVFASDLDNDGDLDVLSASKRDGKIAWYENLLYTTGIDEEVNTYNSIHIYPNPATKLVNIQHDEFKNGNHTCDIFDMYGRLVLTKDITEGQTTVKIDISFLQAGIYLVRLKGLRTNIGILIKN